jgi:D-alanyl-D-alanine carboxypeptidase
MVQGVAATSGQPRSGRRRQPRTAVLLAVVLAFAVAVGCSSSTTGDASPTTAVTTTPATSVAPRSTTTAAPAPVPHAVDRGEAQALLDAWREQVSAFGAIVGMRVPGQPDLLLASGVDDRNPDSPMPTDGRFFIASITKTFTGALVLLLADDGVLSLDDPVEHWLPGVVPRGDQITVRMLLSHTSGLADLLNDDPGTARSLFLADLTRKFTPREAIDYSTALPPVGPPGSQFHYANANYQILGEVVAAAGHAPLAEQIRTRLTEPLGLRQTSLDDGQLVPGELHSWFTLDEARGDPNAGTFDPTVPRDLDLQDFPRTALISFAGGAGGMRSTVSDLLAWADALYGGRVLSTASTELLTGVPGGTALRGARYGLGVIGFEPEGGEATGAPAFVGHDGDTIGNRSLLVRTSSGVDIAIHTNVEEVTLKDLVTLVDRLVALT